MQIFIYELNTNFKIILYFEDLSCFSTLYTWESQPLIWRRSGGGGGRRLLGATLRYQGGRNPPSSGTASVSLRRSWRMFVPTQGMLHRLTGLLLHTYLISGWTQEITYHTNWDLAALWRIFYSVPISYHVSTKFFHNQVYLPAHHIFQSVTDKWTSIECV